MIICYYYLIFGVVVSFSFAKRFTGSVDGRIRKCLIEGLKRFHSNTAPLIEPTFPLIESFDSKALAALPLALTQDTFINYLDAKSLIEISRTSKGNLPIAGILIPQRLTSFNPHFVFEDPVVNILLLAVLDKHFPKSKSLLHASIHDELQLLIIKYLQNDLNFDSISKNIYFFLIAFINEAVYGIDAKVPITVDEFCKCFAALLMKFDIPSTAEYFLALDLPQLTTISRDTTWRESFELFRQKPGKDAIKAYFKIIDINTWMPNEHCYVGFLSVIYEAFIDELTDASVLYLNTEWPQRSIRVIQERFFSIAHEGELIQMLWIERIPREAKTLICKKLQERFGRIPDICHVYTRNILNEFSFDNPFSADLIRNFCDNIDNMDETQSLYYLEMISQMMNSNIINSRDRFNSFIPIIIRGLIEPFSILMKETVKPINLFQHFGVYNTITYYLSTDFRGMKLEFIHAINDPLICLLMPKKDLISAAQIVQNKNFNMNKLYRFDKGVRDDFSKFRYRTMHFKQIVKDLNDSEICEIFSSNPHEFEGDFTVIDESLPVTIINENFTFTPNYE